MLSLLLILVPLVIGAGLLLTRIAVAKWIALFSSLLSLALMGVVLFTFDPSGGLQELIRVPWVEAIGIHFHIGIDGLNIIPLLLTALLTPFIILSAYNRTYESEGVFYGLMLTMQAALFGVFLSQDAFLYYLFWEAALIPIYFLCALYGGAARVRITWKFFLYTIVGSLFMLIAFIFLYLHTPGSHSSAVYDLYRVVLTPEAQTFVFFGLFIAFAIKMPIFPFHTWQPDTYAESPTQGTMLLSGIMLKMGVYSLYKWLLPIVPDEAYRWAGVVIILSITGILYGAIIAIQQRDIKRLLAYSSFSHVGLMAAGIFTFTLSGLQGGMIQMFSHGINVVGLFYVADILSQRTGSRFLSEMGGLTRQAPKLTVFFIILLLGSVALPLTNGFIGEFLLLKGIFEYNLWLAVIAGLTIIFGAVYMLRFFQTSLLGEPAKGGKTFTDVSLTETLVFLPLVILVILIGVYPGPILQLTEPAISELLKVMSR